MRQLLPTFLFLILFLILIATAPSSILSITGETSEKLRYNILHDTYSVSFLSVNQSRTGEQEIIPKSNSFCVNYDNRTMTINICGGKMDMTALHSIINNSKILNQTSPKNWFLNANILIAKGATLFVNSTDTDWLKINSTAGTAYSISTKGNLLIDNTKISSWNFTNKSDTLLNSKAQPRGYLVVPWDGTGHMNITNSNLSYLGYGGGTNTWGISYYAGDGSIISNSSFSFNYRGFHASDDASNIMLVNNTINNSYQHGILAHINSTNLQIYNNAIHNNANHGVFCSELCKNILMKNNSVYNNTGNGIFLNRLTVGSEIENNTIYHNGDSGIRVSNSSRNVIANNTIEGNSFGIIITQSSYNNSIHHNMIKGSDLNGIYLYENSNDNTFKNNTIIESIGNGIYVQGKGTSNNTFIKNNITRGSSYGIQFFNASNNILLDNTIYNNSNYNYYGKSGSINTIIDTPFNNATLRFFDDQSRFILQYTDNKIIGVSNKKIINTVYPTNTTLLIKPFSKSIILDTYDMSVIPSSNHVNITASTNDFKTNEKYKKWSEISPPGLPITTKYMIGGFEPNTQISINVNGSFWNAYTSNSSGYITFLYDRYYTLKQFEAEANNKPALAAILFLVIIVIGLAILFVIFKQRKRMNKTLRHNIGQQK
jgi:parallel beta-helix repeat protein